VSDALIVITCLSLACAPDVGPAPGSNGRAPEGYEQFKPAPHERHRPDTERVRRPDDQRERDRRRS
jgi:hypothetical protein